MSRTGSFLSALLILGAMDRNAFPQEAGEPVARMAPARATAFPRAASNPSASSVEHWDKLPLSENDLRPDVPIPGQIDTFPGFTRELVRVQWRTGDPIDLYIIRPAGAAKPPVILYLYSYPAESDRYLNMAFSKTVTKDGYAAVGFVSALTGQRYHDRPMKQWFVSELQEALATSVHDVQMVLNYLATRGDFDMSRVGIFGQGSGGTIAILSAAVDPRLKAVDVMDPWGDWPAWMAKSPLIPEHERAAYVDPDFLARIAPLDPLRHLRQLDGRPLRLQENLFTTTNPEAVRNRFEFAVGKTATVEYRDVNEYAEQVSTNGRMLNWLETKLTTRQGQ